MKKDAAAVWYEQTADLPVTDPALSPEDRIVGAIMGLLIGDALGLGCHWYYDFEKLWQDYGTWVDDYRDPRGEAGQPSFGYIAAYRFQAGVRAGFNSQTGQLVQVLMEHLAEKGEFIREDYAAAVNRFFEHQLLPQASWQEGRLHSLSGRFTNTEIRQNFDLWYHQGAKDGRWWEDNSASSYPSADFLQMAVVLAGLYRRPADAFEKAYQLLSMWCCEKAYISQSLAYVMAAHALISGAALKDLPHYLTYLVNSGSGGWGAHLLSFDDVRSAYIALDMLRKPQLFPVADDRFMSLVYGQDCHLGHVLPCAYYYAYKYADRFEQGVLTAVNSGGQNMARAAATGALIGGMVGIGGIPQRFIAGLKSDARATPEAFPSHGEYLLALAKTIAAKRI